MKQQLTDKRLPLPSVNFILIADSSQQGDFGSSLLCLPGEGWSAMIPLSHLEYNNLGENNRMREECNEGEGESQRGKYSDMERKSLFCP